MTTIQTNNLELHNNNDDDRQCSRNTRGRRGHNAAEMPEDDDGEDRDTWKLKAEGSSGDVVVEEERPKPSRQRKR